MNKRSLMCVVDDAESVRESLPDLLRHVGFATEAFDSAESFLASEAMKEANCLLLDVGLPGMSGPDFSWNCRAAASRFRSSSSQPRATSRSGRCSSGAARWRACSSHSATTMATISGRCVESGGLAVCPLHHRLWRCADDGPGDEGGRRRIPDQAVQRRRAARRHPSGASNAAVPRSSAIGAAGAAGAL